MILVYTCCFSSQQFTYHFILIWRNVNSYIILRHVWSGKTASGVTLVCKNTMYCISFTVLCSMVAITKQVFGCYTDSFYLTGTSTWAKAICVLFSSALVAFCKVRVYKNIYTWTTRLTFKYRKTHISVYHVVLSKRPWSEIVVKVQGATRSSPGIIG